MENNVRKGRCRNYGDCDRAGEEFTIEDGKPFECPECHQPLVPLDGPKTKGRKEKNMTPIIIGGVVVLAAIIIVLYLLLRIPGDNTEAAGSNIPASVKVDSVAAPQEAIPNRNDTLVIKMEGSSVDNETVAEDTVEKAKEITENATPKKVKTKQKTTYSENKSPVTSSHKLSYGAWTGGWKNGQPHGTGTLTYSTTRRIDARDTKGRVAQPGEYIVGEWDNGHLVQGRWFKNDGTKEAVIIGKAG